MNISGINSGLTELVKKLQKSKPHIKIEEKDAQIYDNITKKASEYFPEEIDYKSYKFQKQYYSPKDFVNKLSTEELEVLKKINGLASKINPSNLTEEGAFNLIQFPGEEKDLDNNGMLSIGEALVYKFPPPNSPNYVKEAWRESTKDMDLKEKMKAESTFWVLEIKANLKYDANGNISGIKSPLDSDYTNIYSQKNTSFFQLVNEYKTYLKNMRSNMDRNNYNEKKEFIDKFEENLYNKKPKISLSA